VGVLNEQENLSVSKSKIHLVIIHTQKIHLVKLFINLSLLYSILSPPLTLTGSLLKIIGGPW
jgi:hypothetical protein